MLRKKFITLNELFDHFHQSKFSTWIDKLSFLNILFLWMSTIVTFGLSYYFLQTLSSHLIYSQDQQPVTSLIDTIYFSFITATSTGFGDIIPRGYFKLIAIAEVVFGLLLLAFVTSKLVSIKQDVIINEIYEISFNERINRLRSSLLLFRQHLSGMIDKIEHKTVSNREINDFYIYISSLEDTLQEIFSLISRQGRYQFTKSIDHTNSELMFNSIIQSFEKLKELLTLLNTNKLEWKRDVTLNSIRKCMEINKSLFEKLRILQILSDKTVTEMSTKNNKVLEDLIKGMD